VTGRVWVWVRWAEALCEACALLGVVAWWVAVVWCFVGGVGVEPDWAWAEARAAANAQVAAQDKVMAMNGRLNFRRLQNSDINASLVNRV
jgi:hypothetical protein